MKFCRFVLFLLACVGAVSAASGQVYDAYAGFSLTQNPSGPWTYGWSNTLAGPLTLYSGTYQANGTYNWTDYSIYALGDPNIGIQPVAGGLPAGTLVFQDVPNVSDCAGTLYWSRPASNSSSPYSVGFETGTQFIADKYDPFISQLKGDVAGFVASGADLSSDFSTSVTLHYQGGFIPDYAGAAGNVRLMLVPIGDGFTGSFEDPVTSKSDSFLGVLLPKSRTGAGLFISDGQSGSVNIQY